MQILPSITTITPGAWRKKLAEVEKFKLKEVCLFLTCLDLGQRKEFYSLFKKVGVKTAPFVHIRSDMELWELDYLAKTYKTKFFNTHTEREHPLLHDYGPHKKSLYIENTYDSFDEAEIREFGGICLDFSHLENDRILRPEIYEADIKALESHQPECSHIAAVKKTVLLDEANQKRIASHHLTKLSELDYLKRYPLEYFGQVAAIELENTIEEQLKAKEYISTLIKNI